MHETALGVIAFPSAPGGRSRGTQSLLLLGLWLYAAGSLLMGSSAAGETFEKANFPPISRTSEIGDRLARCWEAPRTEPPQIIEVTVRLSFSRFGAVIGEPRVTYIRAPAQPGLREKIAISALAAIKACTPLPFTPALGQAIAGRMFAIRLNSLPLIGRQRFV